MNLHACSSDACSQGKRPCPTPTACGSEVMGGTYWPLLAEAKPHIDPIEDEPMSALVVACVIAVAIACVAAVIYSIATN
jgi:hypothetical protein